MNQIHRILKFCVRKDKLNRLIALSNNQKDDFKFINEFLHDTRNLKTDILTILPLNRGVPIINRALWFRENELLYYIGHEELNRTSINYSDALLNSLNEDNDFILFSTERNFGYIRNHENENFIIQ
jgi:hypothetical protein